MSSLLLLQEEEKQPNSESVYLGSPVPSEGQPTPLPVHPAVREIPAYSIYHIDDCMYVAAMSEADAIAYVRAECGEDCADPDWIDVASPDFMVETADVDEGEVPTPTSKKRVGELVDDHLIGGGKLPFTVAFDAGM